MSSVSRLGAGQLWGCAVRSLACAGLVNAISPALNRWRRSVSNLVSESSGWTSPSSCLRLASRGTARAWLGPGDTITHHFPASDLLYISIDMHLREEPTGIGPGQRRAHRHREDCRCLSGVREGKRGTRLDPGSSSSVSARLFFTRARLLRHSSSSRALIMRRRDCRRLLSPASTPPPPATLCPKSLVDHARVCASAALRLLNDVRQ